MQKIALIDCQDSFTYNLAQILEQSALCSFDVIPLEQIGKIDFEEYQKIMISPGPGLPQDYPELKKLAVDNFKKKSIIGICLGHQIIALAFGGTIKKMKPIMHGEKSLIHIKNNDDKLFIGIDSPFPGGRYHSWGVNPNTLPANIIISATDENNNIMAIKHKKHDVFGVQFHPESILTKYGDKIIHNWLRLKK